MLSFEAHFKYNNIGNLKVQEYQNLDYANINKSRHACLNIRFN